MTTARVTKAQKRELAYPTGERNSKRRAATTNGAEQIHVEALRRTGIEVTIVGTTPLLCNRIPESVGAKLDAKNFPAKGDETAEKGPKEVVTAEEVYLGSRYMLDAKTHGFPLSGIKAAMLAAVRNVPGKELNMTNAKPLFYIQPTDKHPEYLPLKFKKVEHATHYGRNCNAPGKPLVHIHRAMYTGWTLTFQVVFNEGKLSAQSIVNLIQQAGAIGLGAYRVPCGGTYGQFEVKASKAKKAA